MILRFIINKNKENKNDKYNEKRNQKSFSKKW